MVPYKEPSYGPDRRWSHEPPSRPDKPLNKAVFEWGGTTIHLFYELRSDEHSNREIRMPRMVVDLPVFGRVQIDEKGKVMKISKIARGKPIQAPANIRERSQVARHLKELFISGKEAHANQHHDKDVQEQLLHRISMLFPRDG